jgi:hypothetical protein
MKSQKTLVLAASIFALALSAFPHHAAADSTTAPPPSDSQSIRKAGGSPLKSLAVELAGDILLSALLP